MPRAVTQAQSDSSIAPTAAEQPARLVSNLDGLETEIAQLPDLNLAELRERWLALYGRPAPKFFRRKLLVRAVAYQMQVKAYGGLSPATMRKLRQIAEAARNGREESVIGALPPRLKLGTRLIRVWRDTSHSVTVVEGGFEWDGRRYGSLSAVAKAITGTSWNGYAFFGVKKRPGRNKNAVKRKAVPDA